MIRLHVFFDVFILNYSFLLMNKHLSDDLTLFSTPIYTPNVLYLYTELALAQVYVKRLMFVIVSAASACNCSNNIVTVALPCPLLLLVFQHFSPPS